MTVEYSGALDRSIDQSTHRSKKLIVSFLYDVVVGLKAERDARALITRKSRQERGRTPA